MMGERRERGGRGRQGLRWLDQHSSILGGAGRAAEHRQEEG